jgi:hypothetical protein
MNNFNRQNSFGHSTLDFCPRLRAMVFAKDKECLRKPKEAVCEGCSFNKAKEILQETIKNE